jgi:drug/metabolite transporter (DMT)-like permease
LTAIIDSDLVAALQHLGVSHASVFGDLQPLLVVLLGVLLCGTSAPLDRATR